MAVSAKRLFGRVPHRAIALAVASAAACGGTSDSTVTMPSLDGGSGDDSGGAGAPAASSSGSSSGAGGGASTGSSSSGGTSRASGDASSGSSGGPQAGGDSGGGACPALTTDTEGVLITLTVSWPATLSSNASTGSTVIRIWLLARLKVAGSNALTYSGQTQTCGTTLPVDPLNGAGQLVTGGSEVQIALPATVWDAPSMPKFDISGTSSGFDVGDTTDFNPVPALIGLTMPDAHAAWPADPWSDSTGFAAGTTFVDSDGDGKRGITAVPVSGQGYTQPPTGLGAFGSAPTADRLYIVSRNEFTLNGKRSSCQESGGSAQVTFFDNHVVGCHIKGGGDCTTGMAQTQADFVDQSRTIYSIGKATWLSRQLATNATCSDVIGAFPVN